MTDRDEVARRIREVFIRSLSLNVGDAELSYSDKLDEAAGLDSIAVLEFLTALEKEFGIRIDPELMELETLKNLPGLADYVVSRLPVDTGEARRTAP